MKKLASIFVSVFVFTALFSINSPKVQASQCQYSSTQARVHKDISDPWKQHMTIGCDKTFEVASFHNETGVYATDTTLRLTGPNGYNKLVFNGQRLTVPDHGTYTLHVSTHNQYGNGCYETATVTVHCPKPEINTCTYTSTEARVQKSRHQPWKESISVYPGQSFFAGSFHNNSGTYATDTTLFIKGPNGYYQPVNHTDEIRLSNKGTYTLHAYTTGTISGTNCHGKAKVIVK